MLSDVTYTNLDKSKEEGEERRPSHFFER